MKDNFCRTLYSRGWIEDGIAYFTYTTEEITLRVAEQVVESRLKLFNGLTYPVVTDGRSVKSIDADAMKYLASSVSTQLVSAGALLVNNQFQKVAGNLFLLINKPAVPAKLFTSEAEALQWLQQFKKIRSTA